MAFWPVSPLLRDWDPIEQSRHNSQFGKCWSQMIGCYFIFKRTFSSTRLFQAVVCISFLTTYATAITSLHYDNATHPKKGSARFIVGGNVYMSGIESSENNCNVVVRQWTWQKLKNTTHLIIGRRLCHLQVITEEKARYHPGTLPIMGPEGLELTTSSQQPFDQLHSLGR